MPVAPPSVTTTQQGGNVLVRASAGITRRSLLFPPPAPCYNCATIAPRLIFSWRSTTLICYVVPPKPPSPPPRYVSTICPPFCTFGRFLAAPGHRSSSRMLALFGAAPPKQPQPSPDSPSAYIYACATTDCASDNFPLPLLSRYEYEERGVRYRRRRRQRRGRWQRRRRRRLKSGFAWGGGVAHACARTTVAATGNGGVVRRDVVTRHWR